VAASLLHARGSEALARRVIRDSHHVRGWMRRHGVHFQPSLSGTLHLSRTNVAHAVYRSAALLTWAVEWRLPSGHRHRTMALAGS
jgi:tricarballylate dehydrogenase